MVRSLDGRPFLEVSPQVRARWWPCGTRAAIVLTLVLVLASLVSACGAGSAASPSVLRYATAAEPDCLDPAVSSADSLALIDRPIFDSLVSLGTDGKFHPWLATSWTISPDGLVYRFVLRHGVTFQDGSPFDAAAVQASLNHVMDPHTQSRYARSLLEGYQETVVVDPYTVEIHLSAPKSALLEALSSVYLGIQSAKALRDSPGNRCVAPVGSGPFTFTSWQRHDSITLTRNAAYAWPPAGTAPPAPTRLQTLVFQFVSEDAARVGELTSGLADVADAIPTTDMATLAGNSRVKLLRAQLPGVPYSLFLNSTRGPLADPRVRLALRSAINIDQLVSSVYRGQYTRAWSPLSPATTYYDPSLVNSWHTDAAQANQLLDAAGWTGRDAQGYRTRNGQRLTLRWPGRAGAIDDQRDVLDQGIQAQARAVGIQIDLAVEDPGAYVNDILHDNLDLFSTSFPRADADILRFFFGTKTPANGGGNVTGIADPALTTELNTASASSDPTVRQTAYDAVQHSLVEDALVIPIYVPETVVGVSSSVHGLTFDARGVPSFTDVWLSR